MLFMTKRNREERFLVEWAPDLAGLLRDAVPHLRYVGARTIEAQTGFLVTAPRQIGAALYERPLNAFICWDKPLIRAFFQDPMANYVIFNASLKLLLSKWQAEGVDMPGGSQREALTMKLQLDAFGIQGPDIGLAEPELVAKRISL